MNARKIKRRTLALIQQNAGGKTDHYLRNVDHHCKMRRTSPTCKFERFFPLYKVFFRYPDDSNKPWSFLTYAFTKWGETEFMRHHRRLTQKVQSCSAFEREVNIIPAVTENTISRTRRLS